MMNDQINYRLQHGVLSDSSLSQFNFCEQKNVDELAEPLTWQERPWARTDDIKKEVQDPLDKVNLGTDIDLRFTYISSRLTEAKKHDIKAILLKYKDCFAWEHHEMPGVDPSIVRHELPIKKGWKPVV